MTKLDPGLGCYEPGNSTTVKLCRPWFRSVLATSRSPTEHHGLAIPVHVDGEGHLGQSVHNWLKQTVGSHCGRSRLQHLTDQNIVRVLEGSFCTSPTNSSTSQVATFDGSIPSQP